MHGLKTKLALSTERIDQLHKTVTSKRSQVGMVEEKLETEKKDADSLKIRLDKEIHEKMSFKV